ncbi:T9SS type A sorting domain-containing protein [bacterium]|nr:T9SS type A sorting domain-containing protein [bacterium]
MIKPLRIAFFGFLALFALILLDTSSPAEDYQAVLAQDSPDQFSAYFHSIRTAEGEVEPGYRPGYRLEAFNQMRAAAKGSQASFPWTERGPGNVGGRTRAIIVDAADPTHSTWIVGSVGGGIWRTTNKGNSWTPLTDHLPRLAIGALAQTPSNPGVMYAGTGEGYRNGDALIGDGMFKSIDGGITWLPLPSTQSNYDFLFVNRIIVSPTDENHVIVATSTGIHETRDGGSTWRELKAAATSLGFYQILHEPGNFKVQYAVEAGRGVWKSTDTGANWFRMNSGLTEASSGARLELDISPVKVDRLFALVESTSGIDPVYLSDNGASTWTQFVDTNTLNPVDIAGKQGWYDLAVLAHPFDKDQVYLGGVWLYKATLSSTVTVNLFTTSQTNTASFLSYINFGAKYLNGSLRLGIDEPESTITPDKMVPVEIRFGPGKSQFAHRFIPPNQAGIDLVAYPYAGYVTVPFEVWDTENNRQLAVSFRDGVNNGVFDLIEQSPTDLGREYLFIHARPYNNSSPDPEIAQTGGVTKDLAYFLWPTLTPGATWNAQNLPESQLRFFWEDAIAPSATISQIGAGVHADQHVMVATPTSGTGFQIVLGNDGGIYYSGNQGTSWVARDRGYNTSQFYGVDKKPGSNTFVGGTQDNGSWTSITNSQPDDFWFSRSGGDGFEAVWHKQNSQKMLVTSQWNFFQRSLNGGTDWQSALGGLTDTGEASELAQFLTVVDQDPTNSDNLYTVGKSGVWKSIDFAETWRLTAIPDEDWGFYRRAIVRVSQKDPAIVWAGSEMDAVPTSGDPSGKLLVSSNRGGAFSPVPTPSIAPGPISGLSTSFDDSEVVYVMFSASNRAKIIRSTDMGQQWEDLSGFDPGPNGLISQNGFPDVTVFDLLDFPNSARLWAATEIGIVESVDNGATWSISEGGLPAVAVWQLRLVDGQIVAATHGRGIWSLPLSQVPLIPFVGTAVENPVLPQGAYLESVYPNPFQTTATLAWNSGQGGQATIRIIDLQGRVVSTIFSGVVSAGAQQLPIGSNGLAAGPYFIQIEQQGSILTKSFVKTN